MSAYTERYSNIRQTWILIFLFIGLVSLVFYVIGWYQGSLVWPVIGLIFSLGQALVAYFFGDKIALSLAGAKEVTYQEAPKIFEITNNLSKIAGIKPPKIYISNDKSPNAFATGRNPQNASICLNQGLLDVLEKQELEGVIAHELAHIKNRDILLMTVTMVLTGLISFVADLGFRILLFSGGRRDRENKSPVIFIIYLITIVLAPIVSALIQLAISRKREFLADATGVTFTRYPEGLISALIKLYNNPTPTSHYQTNMNHFYIAPPKKVFGEKFNDLFNTHPPIQARVAALKKM